MTTPGCNPDWTAWSAGSRTQWEPVKGLTFGVDVIYQHLDSANPGVINLATGAVGTAGIAPAGGKVAGAYVVDDQDTWAATFRVQRNFLP